MKRKIVNITVEPRNAMLSFDNMPEFEKDSLCKTVAECAKRFYENPENVVKYELWRAKRYGEGLKV